MTTHVATGRVTKVTKVTHASVLRDDTTDHRRLRDDTTDGTDGTHTRGTAGARHLHHQHEQHEQLGQWSQPEKEKTPRGRIEQQSRQILAVCGLGCTDTRLTRAHTHTHLHTAVHTPRTHARLRKLPLLRPGRCLASIHNASRRPAPWTTIPLACRALRVRLT